MSGHSERIPVKLTWPSLHMVTILPLSQTTLCPIQFLKKGKIKPVPLVAAGKVGVLDVLSNFYPLRGESGSCGLLPTSLALSWERSWGKRFHSPLDHSCFHTTVLLHHSQGDKRISSTASSQRSVGQIETWFHLLSKGIGEVLLEVSTSLYSAQDTSAFCSISSQNPTKRVRIQFSLQKQLEKLGH